MVNGHPVILHSLPNPSVLVLMNCVGVTTLFTSSRLHQQTGAAILNHFESLSLPSSRTQSVTGDEARHRWWTDLFFNLKWFTLLFVSWLYEPWISFDILDGSFLIWLPIPSSFFAFPFGLAFNLVWLTGFVGVRVIPFQSDISVSGRIAIWRGFHIWQRNAEEMLLIMELFQSRQVVFMRVTLRRTLLI
jgi:hypothetical protein